MSFSVTVDWSPLHEFLVSFDALSERRRLKYLEFDAAWQEAIAKSVGPYRSTLTSLFNPREQPSLSPFLDTHDLLRLCPEPRTPDVFINWLAGLTVPEMRPLTRPIKGRTEICDEELLAAQDLLVVALDVWNTEYFSNIGDEVSKPLRLESEYRRKTIARLDPKAVVEDATKTIRLEDDSSIHKVVLSPQYHYRPYILSCRQEDTLYFHYPVDPWAGDGTSLSIGPEQLAQALSDTNRLQILKFLGTKPRTFMEIVAFSGLAKSTVNYHLGALKSAGIIRIVMSSKRELYTPNPGYLDALGHLLKRYMESDDAVPRPENKLIRWTGAF